MRRIVVAGGGTGGHLFPGIAIAQEFLTRAGTNQVLFAGTGRPLERRILARAGFTLSCIRAEGLKGVGLRRQLAALLKMPAALSDAMRVLYRFRPDLVIGMGGYSAGPVVLAAGMAGIPTAVHEQNVLPGITNRLLSRIVDRVYTSFEASAPHFPAAKVRCCGNPVRQEMRLRDVPEATPEPSEDRSGFCVLVIGGSQGAHAVNRAVWNMLPQLAEATGYRFVHQTGDADLAPSREAYRRLGMAATVEAFFDDMHRRYRQADLVISRAGATTVAELTVMGKAAILIPFPHAADDHQVLNARALVAAGGAEMILESELNADLLARRVAFFTTHRGRLAEMARASRSLGKPQAAQCIVDDWQAV